MNETYCPVCRLIHREELAFCCKCEGELVEKPDESNGEDLSCPICVDQIELA